MTLLNLNNKYRTLLTEVLPYEVPLTFDNYAFYQNVNDTKKKAIFESQFNCDWLRKKRWYIPFNYCIRKYGSDHNRCLSIMHPLSQLDAVEFYHKYANYLIYLCSKSPFSLRHISQISKCIFDEKKNPTNPDDKELQTYQEYRSYFKYEYFERYYKFFESADLVRLEQRYKHCMKLDLSKCFYHIYTHSVTWAVKNKEYAKKHTAPATIENLFDELMRKSNYNETNGIIVGPELSRIFAEIILQRIDLDILEELTKLNYLHKKDFDIRRYVDDYLIFTNDKSLLETIKNICEIKCEPYKLYLNENKMMILERPFSTDISSAKNEVYDLIENTFEKKNHINDLTAVARELTFFARKFSSAAYKNKVNYSEITRYGLYLIKEKIQKNLNSSDTPDETKILFSIDASFYLFSLDMMASGSIHISRIIDLIISWNEKITDEYTKQNIKDHLYHEAKRCLDIYESTSKKDQTNIEILNLLLVLHRRTNFDINEALIRKIFSLSTENGIESGYDKLDYFQICTILYILEDKANPISSNLVKEIQRRFDEKDEPLLYSELTLLYFDILACPYVNSNDKFSIYLHAQKKNQPSATERILFTEEIKKIEKVGRWFFIWDKNKNFTSIIGKKDYNSSY